MQNIYRTKREIYIIATKYFVKILLYKIMDFTHSYEPVNKIID